MAGGNDQQDSTTFFSAPAVEPFRAFRWVINAPNLGSELYAMKVDKPMFKVGEYAHKFLNHQFNYPGRVVWDPITITLVDMPGATGANDKLYKFLAAAGYYGPTDGLAQTGGDGLSKQSATTALGDVSIVQLAAGTSTLVQNEDTSTETHKTGTTWELKNAFITDVKFGNLDYGSEDAVQVTLTVRYDWATSVDNTAAAPQVPGA